MKGIPGFKGENKRTECYQSSVFMILLKFMRYLGSAGLVLAGFGFGSIIPRKSIAKLRLNEIEWGRNKLKKIKIKLENQKIEGYNGFNCSPSP